MKKLSILPIFIFILLASRGEATIKNINVQDTFFDPAFFYVSVGDTIRWTLVGGTHTTTSTIIPAAATPWAYAFTGIGDTYNYVAVVPGDYSYQCGIHGPTMSGSFTVVSNALPFYEDFTYTAGELLTAHGWTNHSGTGNNIMTIAGSLSYSGYPSSGIGNHVNIQGGSGSREDINWAIQEQNTNGSSVYFSFLANVDSASTTTDYFMHLGDRVASNAFTSFSARVFVQSSSGNLKFGVNNTSTALMGPTNFVFGTTYLLIVKYTINTGGTDEAKLWVFSSGVPPDETSAGTPEVTSTASSGQDLIDAIGLRQGGQSYSVNTDGIRVATSWNDIVLPVELTSFTATSQTTGVLLNWSTSTEINNYGFDIERKSANQQWQKVGFVEGNGTTSETQNYSYFDKDLNSGKYQYRLKQIDFDGSFEHSNIVEVNFETPSKFDLSQNYPNPFNPTTTISYSLPKANRVSLKVYNALGQEVAILVNETKEAGNHKIDFNASNLYSGIYFYKLEAGDISQVKKMTLIK